MPIKDSLQHVHPIHFVGMSPGALRLPPKMWHLLQEADILCGGRRLLAAAALAAPPSDNAASVGTCLENIRQIPVTCPLEKTIDTLQQEQIRGSKIVVLADGDPLFYGFGKRLLDDIGAERLVFHPNTTTLQLAAARLQIPWQDIHTVSLHGRNNMAPLLSAIVKYDRVAVYTDSVNTPTTIAETLLNKGAEGFFLTVLEDLDTPQEIIRRLSPEEVWDLEFSELNLVIIERSYPPEIPLAFGTPDFQYMHERGLITKQPVRATGLSMLHIQPNSTVWDLGAGCGAVGIEASALAHEGIVYAVEQHKRRVATIKENIRRMGAWQVDVIHGALPDAIDSLPDPDRIFIGGGLGGSQNSGTDLLSKCAERLTYGGKIVVHCILLDTLIACRTFFQEKGWNHGFIQVQASTSKPLAGDIMLKPQNPVFIIWAEKS